MPKNINVHKLPVAESRASRIKRSKENKHKQRVYRSEIEKGVFLDIPKLVGTLASFFRGMVNKSYKVTGIITLAIVITLAFLNLHQFQKQDMPVEAASASSFVPAPTPTPVPTPMPTPDTEEASLQQDLASSAFTATPSVIEPEVQAQAQPQAQLQQKPMRVNQAVKDLETAPAPAAASYTIKANDTLWHIAKEVYGDGNQWVKIWEANKSSLIQEDKRNASDAGHWIHPGTVLTLPSS